MSQDDIDDLSDLLQGRDSEHRKYPYGHPKYKPDPGTPLAYVPGMGSRLTVEFESTKECKKFFDIFQSLGADARHRTLEHLKQFGTIVHEV